MISKKTAHTLLIPACFFGCAMLTVSAHAEPKRSVLLSVGQATQAEGNVSGQLESLGYPSVSTSADKSANAWSLGYRHPLNVNWSADIQYLQQGKTTPELQATLPLGKTTEQAVEEATEAMPKRGQGISVVAVYHYPIDASKLNLQAGFGAFFWRSKRTATIDGSAYIATTEGFSPVLQFGVSYPLTNSVQLEAYWQYINMPGEPVNRIAVGVAVDF